jgi:DNA-binding XRE family transcriptional regulator
MNSSQATPGSGGSAFGRLLKEWRGRRGYSQLDLALAARTTQRHLSFIESGRSRYSAATAVFVGSGLSSRKRGMTSFANSVMLATVS